MRFTIVLAVVLLVFFGVFHLVQAIQKTAKEGAELRIAATTARDAWTNGSDEQRKAMLAFIDVTKGSYRDSLLTKVWNELPELVRTSITKNFR